MVLRLVFAVGVLLALPGTAMAVTIEGPTSIGEGAGKATYTVRCGDALLPGLPYTGPVTVSTDPPPPSENPDYGEPTTTTVPVCNESFTFEVPIFEDTEDEGNESFTVTATGVPAGEITTTIVDNDPVASIEPAVFVTEGDSGATNANLKVTLSSAPVQRTTIAYGTDNLSAEAGADYTATSGNLVFEPGGDLSKTISVPVIGDTTSEQFEAFFVNLVSTDNGSLRATARQAGVGIADNDVPPVPAASISRTVSVEEGNRGSVNALFEVALSFVPTQEVRVSWKTVDWTAIGTDYRSGQGTLVFQPGQRTKSVSVDIRGDRADEPDEAFGVALANPVGGTLAATKAGFGIITDDDGPKMRIGKPKARRRALVTKLSCPETTTQCVGHLVVKMGKRRVGTATFDLAKGTKSKLRVPMSRRARRKLQRRAVRVRLIATANDASGDARKTKRKARLKRRR